MLDTGSLIDSSKTMDSVVHTSGFIFSQPFKNNTLWDSSELVCQHLRIFYILKEKLSYVRKII